MNVLPFSSSNSIKSLRLCISTKNPINTSIFANGILLAYRSCFFIEFTKNISLDYIKKADRRIEGCSMFLAHVCK
ncbi:hypothetical protein J2750_000802 [Methanococcoides alaskense]|uniref:Uncharacterized protein n=1 Tax=Methanococcoides alaskense TaxID=325778 RepID=A0AA90TYP2_9EURY|nr:hypothetical protein [Methanococcoides alaskense]